MSTTKTCQNCIFAFAVKSQHEIGKIETVCKRFPPTPIAISAETPRGLQVQILTVFPSMADGMSCGEHVDRELN